MAEELRGKAKRVRIYLTDDDRIGHQQASLAIVELLRRDGAPGATVFRGVGGFGAAGEIRTAQVVDVARRLPVVVEWIDHEDAVRRLLPRVEKLAPSAFITVDDTEVVLGRPRPVRDLPKEMTVADAMSREVDVATADMSVRQVVEEMLGKPYRALPVVEGGMPIGIITNSDLVQRAGLGARLSLLKLLREPELRDLLEQLSRSDRTAADIMTRSPVTTRETATLREVAQVMNDRRLKRLPVVDERGSLVGVISRFDLLRAASSRFEQKEPPERRIGLSGNTPLSRVMRRDVTVVHPETPLSEVFQAVVSTRLHRAIVVDGEHRVVGLVTDGELLERITPSLRRGALRSLMDRLPFTHPDAGSVTSSQHAKARTAGDLMIRDVAVAQEDSLLGDAIGTMLQANQKILAITDSSGRLVGMVDRADVLRGLLPPE